MNIEFRKILEKQHYGLVGNHSGIKLCHWMRQSLLYNRECYKQTFYGIQSHRCLQMTPSINQCNHTCLFCWRHQGFTEKELITVDEPKYILDKSIETQKKLITGFKGDERCNQKKWEEASLNLKRLVESDPTDREAWGYLAIAYARLGKKDKAEEAFKKSGR